MKKNKKKEYKNFLLLNKKKKKDENFFFTNSKQKEDENFSLKNLKQKEDEDFFFKNLKQNKEKNIKKKDEENFWEFFKEICSKKIFDLSIGSKKYYYNKKNWRFILLLNKFEIISCESNLKFKIKKIQNYLSLFLIKYFFEENFFFSDSFSFKKKLIPIPKKDFNFFNQEITKLLIFENNNNFVFEYLREIKIKNIDLDFEKISSSSSKKIICLKNEKNIIKNSKEKILLKNEKNILLKNENNILLINSTENILLKNSKEKKIISNKLKREKKIILLKKKKNILLEEKKILKEISKKLLIKKSKKDILEYYIKKYPIYLTIINQLKKYFQYSKFFLKFIKKKKIKKKKLFHFNKEIFNRIGYKFYNNLLKKYFKEKFGKNIYLFFIPKEEFENKKNFRKIIFRFSKNQSCIFSLIDIDSSRKRLFFRNLFLNVIINFFQI